MKTLVVPEIVEAAVIEWAATLLRGQGFTVLAAHEQPDWVTPKQFRLSLTQQLVPNTFHSRLRSPEAPAFASHRSPNGRIIKLRPTPELREWMDRPVQPGKRNDL